MKQTTTTIALGGFALTGTLVALACEKQDTAIAPVEPRATATDSTGASPTPTSSTSATPAASAAPSASNDEAPYYDGTIGLLNSGGGVDPNAPTAPWGRDSLDAGELARGNMWGESIGQSFGVHGVGDGGAHVHVARLRQGVTTVNGRLPPEVVQRIVRQNFGRLKLCYTEGLRKKADLAGTVSTQFVIDRSGAVSKVSRDAATNLPDADVVACVVRGFSNLSFPQPEGGTVTVTYPLIFEPPEKP